MSNKLTTNAGCPADKPNVLTAGGAGIARTLGIAAGESARRALP